MHLDLVQLASGSDIRGVALETENGPTPELTDNAAMKIGYAFNKWYEKKFGKKLEAVAIGRDPRLTGPNLAQAISLGLIVAGSNVYDTGLATSPAMFMLTQAEDVPADVAVMVTASHMPKEYNGIKIVTKDGGLSGTDIKEILTLAEDIVTDIEPGTKRTEIDFLPEYKQSLIDMIRSRTGEEKPLEGSKIVIDPGNGSGGFFIDVLEALGADTSGSQFLEPDGNFPNHIPNPENQDAINAIKKAVLDNNAEMGIIFDTDVDRSAIIDEKGDVINRNAFIAFIASLLLEDHPGATIVTDSVTSDNLTDYIEKLGGKHHRFKRGYKNVIDEAKRLNKEGVETVLAMETSGHGAVFDNYFLDDGAYLAALSLVAMAKAREKGIPLSGLIEGYVPPKEEKEIRLKITDPDFRAYGQKLLDAFKTFAQKQNGWSFATPNYEGIRVNCDKDNGNGWLLIRQSLHEPKIVINMESNSEGGIEKIESRLEDFLSGFEKLER